jgi:hypothetical protein
MEIMIMTRNERKEQFDVVEMVAKEAFDIATSQQPDNPFGHGFLWATCSIGGKSTRFIVGYIQGRSNWSAIEEAVQSSCHEITSTWINID